MSDSSVQSDINVLWMSRTRLIDGMSIVPHTHDFFHFSYSIRGTSHHVDGRVCSVPVMSCSAPGELHAGGSYSDDFASYNLMFTIRDKDLSRTVETFPFQRIREPERYAPVLDSLFEQVRRLHPSPAFINAAVSYFLRLVLLENKDLVLEDGNLGLAERCKKYIEEHYMEQVRLEDIAGSIGKNPSYTSSLFSSTCGITLIEYLNSVRVKKACSLIAYTETPLEDIEKSCGFNNHRNFCRVFKDYVGTLPRRYRTSHMKRLLSAGELSDEDLSSFKFGRDDTFTYIVNAQKEITWDNAYDFLQQYPGASATIAAAPASTK